MRELTTWLMSLGVVGQIINLLIWAGLVAVMAFSLYVFLWTFRR